jgi:hypothetical protein
MQERSILNPMNTDISTQRLHPDDSPLYGLMIKRREMNAAFIQLVAWVSTKDNGFESIISNDFNSQEEIPFTPEQFEKDFDYFSTMFAKELGMDKRSRQISCLVEEFLANYYSGIPEISAISKSCA